MHAGIYFCTRAGRCRPEPVPPPLPCVHMPTQKPGAGRHAGRCRARRQCGMEGAAGCVGFARARACGTGPLPAASGAWLPECAVRPPAPAAAAAGPQQTPCASWRRQLPPPRPPPSGAACMAHDAARTHPTYDIGFIDKSSSTMNAASVHHTHRRRNKAHESCPAHPTYDIGSIEQLKESSISASHTGAAAGRAGHPPHPTPRTSHNTTTTLTDGIRPLDLCRCAAS